MLAPVRPVRQPSTVGAENSPIYAQHQQTATDQEAERLVTKLLTGSNIPATEVHFLIMRLLEHIQVYLSQASFLILRCC